MIRVDDILNKWGKALTDRLVNDIQTKMIERKGSMGQFSSTVNASGKLADSITYKVDVYRLKVQGNDYIYYLQNGRGPNKNQSKEALWKFAGWAGSTFIKDWINDRGLDLNPFAVAYNLGKNGSSIFQAGGSDLVSGIFNEALQDSIEDDFSKLVASEISSEILKMVA